MPKITDMTLEQLRAATVAEILSSIKDYLVAHCPTKRALIAFLLDADTLPDAPVCTYYPDGQIMQIVEVIRDAETGVVVSGVKTTYTYYPTGEVDVIVIAKLDAVDDEISRVKIKHYLDGRQPKIVIN